MRNILSVVIFCGVMLFAAAAHATEPPADAILGQWFTEGDESIVEIYKAGDCYCGKIVWLKEPKKADGTDKVDSNNPDASRRKCKVVGMDILTGVKYNGRGTWTSGKIYDPNNGKTYSCNAKLEKDKLSIRGFIGVSLLGRTTVWKRTEQSLAATKDLTQSR
jgi:uncharacterized protein (DUF2147 family)